MGFHVAPVTCCVLPAEPSGMLPQVLEVCQAANPRLVVKRARFSALIHGDLTRAVQNLVAPDSAASAAVDARQEIDLRIGASFTRFQTLLLQALHLPLLPDHEPNLSACALPAHLVLVIITSVRVR